MKKVITAIVLAFTVFSAFASCPIGTRYMCTQGAYGKMICGCY